MIINKDKIAALEVAMRQIEKQFGKGAIMKLGSNISFSTLCRP
ncbi:hypothetical protein GOM49_01855 [Clostridium bovifaecis]|uniref:DNA recombination/repair protein RecA n=1 Tax=Clostridium bovifaecis TaxID=2184719 RepID=A0A6I6ETC8_9CLOT|nr:hypothetical protein GOM49_01855 [Clostridium bovifaecis]